MKNEKLNLDANNKQSSRREAISKGVKVAALGAIAASGVAFAKAAPKNDLDKYKDQKPMLPRDGINYKKGSVGIVVIDPQIDFLSPKGVTWGAFGASIKEHGTVEHLLEIFKSADANNIPTFISPHFYYPTDHKWNFGGPVEHFMHNIHMFDRKSAFSMDGFEGSGADFMPEFKPYIFNGKTIIANPHKLYGPQTNDLSIQLRKRGISQIILCGMSANLCVESHLRHLLEEGFEVCVVRDATAGAKLPDGDAYLSAIINYRYIANDLVTTKEALKIISKIA